jgi:AcrR family transcriptional regulator
VSLQSVAQRAGLPLERVQAQFATFDDLVPEVVHVWYSERMAGIMPIAEQFGAVRFLRAIVVANCGDPGLMRLLSALVNVCATHDHPMAPVLQQQWTRFHALVQRALAHDVELGREPDTMDPARGAEQLIAMYEGLQLQAMVRPAMNLPAAYDRAVTRLRDGWRQEYVPPVWEI